MTDDNTPTGISTQGLQAALGERYLTYALSTIMNRALPDARDGLKPVHRRILYTMRELRLEPGAAFRKCAKIVGDTMGNYHPHGDGAIYDAMVRMAQDFLQAYPLVDGQGNFGNIDGDGAAAYRYTEARMTRAAALLMDGLTENAVDFRENFDGSRDEPVVLPAAYPNLLANGAAGIAVGMATNIPPHNIGELIDAACALIDQPETPTAQLLEHVKGPDFPTGGVLIEPPETIRAAYETGRGALRVRAAWEVEKLPRGQWQIVVTEIPYQVQKSRLIEKIADLIQTKKLPALGDIRDESTDDIRLVLEPRAKTIAPEMLMEALFKASDLETRFALNMNVLIDGITPRVCDLAALLRAFLDFRREVVARRAQHRLDAIEKRLEILAGYLIAFLNIDRVIEIIRTEDHPKQVMMAEFGINDVQAEAVLNLRLRALRKLEEMEIRRENDALIAERDELTGLLGDEKRQWRAVRDALGKVRKELAAPRRTRLEAAPDVAEIPMEAMIDREPVTVICSKMGWIRTMRGHNDLSATLKFKDGDGPGHALHAHTTDKLLVMGAQGRFYTLNVADLPGGRGMGEPIRLMVDLPQEADIVDMFVHKPGTKRLIASTAGDGFVIHENDALAQTKSGKQVLNVKAPARALLCRPIAGDHVACVGENRKMLVFPLDELPEMARGKGVRLQKFKDGGLSDATTVTYADGLRWQDPAGRTRHEADLGEWLGKRATAGRMAPRGFPRDNRFDHSGAMG